MRELFSHEKEPILRALRACEVASPALCLDAVHSCRIVPLRSTLAEVRCPRTAVAVMVLDSRAAGITLGTRVYVRNTLCDHHLNLPLDLVAHEVAHVAQFLREGTSRFLRRYVQEYLGHRARGLGDYAAYMAISYEIEARAVAKALEG